MHLVMVGLSENSENVIIADSGLELALSYRQT